MPRCSVRTACMPVRALTYAAILSASSKRLATRVLLVLVFVVTCEGVVTRALVREEAAARARFDSRHAALARRAALAGVDTSVEEESYTSIRALEAVRLCGSVGALVF